MKILKYLESVLVLKKTQKFWLIEHRKQDKTCDAWIYIEGIIHKINESQRCEYWKSASFQYTPFISLFFFIDFSSGDIMFVEAENHSIVTYWKKKNEFEDL